MFVLSFIIVMIYLIILIWFSNAIYYKKFDYKNKDFYHHVSIIVAAKNEENNLPGLIKALINQSYPSDKYEIIVVNDKSNDQTQKLLNIYNKKYHNVKSFNISKTPIGWSSKKWALNKAIELASSDIIMQTDADCIPSEKWIETISKYFSNPRINFVCSPSYLEHKDTLLNKIFRMETLVQEAINAGAIKNNLILSCTGRNIAFRKKWFNLIDGYVGDEHIQSGDDDLLLQKFALRTDGLIEYSIDSKSLVKSMAPLRFVDFFKQRLRFASKGLYYFKIKTTLEFKGVIILIYSTNVLFIILLFSLFTFGNFIFFIPILMKLLADFLLSFVFMSKVKQPWSVSAFFLLSFLFPFYVAILGLLGPLIPVGWKSK